MRWLPVNVAAEALYAQIQHSTSRTSRVDSHLTVYSLENGRSTSWRDVTNAIIDFGINVSPQAKPKLVDMKEWLHEASQVPESPVFHLLEFFETYVQGKFTPPLDLKYSKQAAGNLLDHDISEEVVRSYVAFACANVKKT